MRVFRLTGRCSLARLRSGQDRMRPVCGERIRMPSQPARSSGWATGGLPSR